MLILKKIKNLDLYGRDISLLFDDSRFKTTIGVVLTIIMIILVIILTTIEVAEIFNGKVSNMLWIMEPYPNQLQDYPTLKEGLTIGFAFQGLGDNQSEIEISPYVQDIKNKITLINPDSSYRCRTEVYRKLVNPNSVPTDLEIICYSVPLSEIKTGSKLGFRISFPSCNGKKICSLRDTLREDSSIWTFTSSYHNHYKEYYNSHEYEYVAKRFDFQKQYSKRVSLYFQEIEIIEGKGIIYTTKTKTLRYLLSREDKDIFEIGANENLILLEYLLDMNNRISVTVLFGSIVNSMAFLGGLFKGLSSLFFVIVMPFREILYYKKMINSMFSVCEEIDLIDVAMGNVADCSTDSKENIIKRGKDYEDQQDYNKASPNRKFMIKKVLMKRLLMKKQETTIKRSKSIPKVSNLNIQGVDKGQSGMMGLLDCLGSRHISSPMLPHRKRKSNRKKAKFMNSITCLKQSKFAEDSYNLRKSREIFSNLTKQKVLYHTDFRNLYSKKVNLRILLSIKVRYMSSCFIINISQSNSLKK